MTNENTERGRRDPREHAMMLECQHTEADAIGPVCLSCGRVSLDPSWLFIAFAIFFFAAQAARTLW